jgi:hypothetical protein
MPLLVDALRGSGDHVARYHASDGSIITVRRMIGQQVSDNTDAYVVSIHPPDQRERDLIASDDLAEAIARMRDLHIPGFQPDAAAWQPASP